MLDNERIEILMYYLKKSNSIQIVDEVGLHNTIAMALNDVVWTDGMSKQTAIEALKEKHSSFLEHVKTIWYRLT